MDYSMDSIKMAQQILSAQSPSASPSPAQPPFRAPSPVTSVEESGDLKKRKEEQEITQQDKRFEAEMEQWRIDRELKKRIATLVFSFLAIETGALFIVVLFQGFRPFNFHLEDSTINIFLGATLLQISSMAVIITRNLYPTSQV